MLCQFSGRSDIRTSYVGVCDNTAGYWNRILIAKLIEITENQWQNSPSINFVIVLSSDCLSQTVALSARPSIFYQFESVETFKSLRMVKRGDFKLILRFYRRQNGLR